MSEWNMDDLRGQAGDLLSQAWETGYHDGIRDARANMALDRMADDELAERWKAEQDLIDANNQMEQLCECSIELPKDADGEVIRVGDKLDGYGKTIEVVELRYGRSGWVLISRDGNSYDDTFAFTHHHEPTVEDVLREACNAYHSLLIEGMSDVAHDMPAPSEIIAEYSAKLRLANDGEEQ